MLFAPTASKYQNKHLTPYADSNSRLQWWKSDHFWTVQRIPPLCDELCSHCSAVEQEPTERSITNHWQTGLRWSPCFGDAQSEIKSAFVLPLPCLQGACTVDTDARDEQRGCVLLQKQPYGTDKSIDYLSPSLNDAKCKYESTRRDGLAIVWAVFLLRLYMERSQFTIQTEHDKFKCILNLTDFTGRLVHWWLQVSKFEFHVVHCTGMKHQEVEALSQLKTSRTDQTLMEAEVSVLCITAFTPRERIGKSCANAGIRCTYWQRR